jgi:ABC-type glycerol-3-phosphate transport system substrate-binding protein
VKRNTLYIILGAVILGSGLYFVLRPGKDSSDQEPKLRFVSLAWQEQALVANRVIVAAWNAAHPEMPVEYVQGTWSSVHDYLITSFETGDVPDVFHYESSVIVDFAMRGFLADLGPMIEPEMKEDITDVAWASVTRQDGMVSGIPFVMESLIGLYDRDALARAGIVPPSFDTPWSWADLRAAAIRLTVDTTGDGAVDRWGAAIGLRNSGNIIMNLSIGFGGSFFRTEGGKYVVRVGSGERELLSTVHAMLYADRSTAPSSAGQSGPAMIPGFFQGRYAMLIGIGAWARQQLVENAPAGFRWGVMPPLKARTQNSGASTQTLSIPAASRRKAEAMSFIRFMLNSENMARLAQSDWMLPVRRSCLARPEFHSAVNGWDVTTASARFLSTGPWMGAPGYVEWKSRVANPVLQEYFSNRLSLDEAARRIEEESNTVLSRYQ